MTYSPFSITLIALVPLAALGWPLAQVINQKPYLPVATEEVARGPLTTADLFVRSAHPFESIEVTIGGASWTFAPDDEVKIIHYPRSESVVLKMTVTWPEGTPETAALFNLQPEGQGERSYTLWGEMEVTEEVEFTWDPEP